MDTRQKKKYYKLIVLFVCLFKKFKTKEIHNRNIIGKKGRSIYLRALLFFDYFFLCLFFKNEDIDRRRRSRKRCGRDTLFSILLLETIFYLSYLFFPMCPLCKYVDCLYTIYNKKRKTFWILLFFFLMMITLSMYVYL